MGVDNVNEQDIRKDLTKAFVTKVRRHVKAVARQQSEHPPHEGGAFNEYFLDQEAFIDGEGLDVGSVPGSGSPRKEALVERR